MNQGTGILLGFLAGVLLAPVVYRTINGGKTMLGAPTPTPAKKMPYTPQSQVMGLGAGAKWDCTQQDWLRQNIMRYNNPFGN